MDLITQIHMIWSYQIKDTNVVNLDQKILDQLPLNNRPNFSIVNMMNYVPAKFPHLTQFIKEKNDKIISYFENEYNPQSDYEYVTTKDEDGNTLLCKLESAIMDRIMEKYNIDQMMLCKM